MSETSSLAERFRGFYPVIIDVETGGFNAETDALLEIAAVTLKMSDDGIIELDQSISHKIEPFEGANIEAAALNFTGIDLEDPDRGAVAESESVNEIFKQVRIGIKESGCTRAILVGHNAVFDHNFLKAAVARCKIKRDPFHPFSCFDTVSLAGLAYGQTVLAKACAAADIDFDNAQAHSALYDTERTADLFCKIVNQWKTFGGWPV